MCFLVANFGLDRVESFSRLCAMNLEPDSGLKLPETFGPSDASESDARRAGRKSPTVLA